MKARASFTSILVSAYLVFSILLGGSAEGVDVARLYSAKKDAVVVIFNERTDTTDDAKKEEQERKKLLPFAKGIDIDPAFIVPTPYIYFSEDQDRVAVMTTGGGFIVRADGLVVTSYHVVKNSRSVTVELASGEFLAAEIIGFDARPDYDIAILKIKADRTFTALPLAPEDDDKVFVGKELLLIGHPYLYKYTASKAAISKLKLDGTPRFIQVNSSILPGNSGSPLIDERGFAVGVIYASMRDSDTQGFATPSWMIREVLDRVLSGAKEK